MNGERSVGRGEDFQDVSSRRCEMHLDRDNEVIVFSNYETIARDVQDKAWGIDYSKMALNRFWTV